MWEENVHDRAKQSIHKSWETLSCILSVHTFTTSLVVNIHPNLCLSVVVPFSIKNEQVVQDFLLVCKCVVFVYSVNVILWWGYLECNQSSVMHAPFGHAWQRIASFTDILILVKIYCKEKIHCTPNLTLDWYNKMPDITFL